MKTNLICWTPLIGNTRKALVEHEDGYIVRWEHWHDGECVATDNIAEFNPGEYLAALCTFEQDTPLPF